MVAGIEGHSALNVSFGAPVMSAVLKDVVHKGIVGEKGDGCCAACLHQACSISGADERVEAVTDGLQQRKQARDSAEKCERREGARVVNCRGRRRADF